MCSKPASVAVRLLWERRLLLALVDGVAVAAAFLIAFNLRSAEIRPRVFFGPGWPILIGLLTWYVSAELVDGYRLVTTGNPRPALAPAIFGAFRSTSSGKTARFTTTKSTGRSPRQSR
jgi:hypothetical protein